nr:hypothetical protein [uncultured Anaerosporobacter sp.]
MLSDEWLRQGFRHGERIEVPDIVDYVRWTDNKNDIIGVSVNFEEADDCHYDIEIEEWMKFLENVLNDTNLNEIPKLLRIFLEENPKVFAFQAVLDSNQIKYDKIAFW